MPAPTVCHCGWKLPASVIPFAHGTNAEPGNEMPGVYVGLECPTCGTGHTFINGHDPDAFVEMRRQQLVRKRR